MQFALVHKFKHRPPKDRLTEKPNLIVLSDEAHRTQYGRLPMNMHMALPKAKFLGFTGTPLIAAEEMQLTREVFGDCVSTYDFRRAVEDDSTVKLYYENRGGTLTLIDPDIRAKIQERIDAAFRAGEIDGDQEEALHRTLAQEYPIVTSPERLKKLAANLVGHYSRRWVSWAWRCGLEIPFLRRSARDWPRRKNLRYDRHQAASPGSIRATRSVPGATRAKLNSKTRGRSRLPPGTRSPEDRSSI